jgi:shikimate dehydrogenase
MSKRFVLIGHPIGHSVSPAMHTAAYRALEVDCQYAAVDCPDEAAVRAQVEALRGGEIAGANVTLPHKKLALMLADEADPVAREVGAANVLVRTADKSIAADNTDVTALAGELRGRVPHARAACIIGNGGAALAAVAACKALGIERIGVVARRWRGEALHSEWPEAERFRALGATLAPWPEAAASERAEQESIVDSAWEALVLQSQIIVQATSAGMNGAEPGQAVRDIVPWLRLDPATLAYDLVYNPPVTPFLEAARAAGLMVEGGLGMLVEQAALSIERWLGLSPPRRAMREAAERVLQALA